MSKPEPEPKTIKVDLVCIGRRLTTKDKLAHFFVELNKNGKPSTDMKSWDGVKGFLGSVYTFTRIVGDGVPADRFQVYTTGSVAPQWKGRLSELDPDTDVQLAAWEAEEARDVHEHERLRMQKGAKYSELEKMLGPVCDAYRKTSFDARKAFKMIVCDILERSYAQRGG